MCDVRRSTPISIPLSQIHTNDVLGGPINPNPNSGYRADLLGRDGAPAGMNPLDLTRKVGTKYIAHTVSREGEGDGQEFYSRLGKPYLKVLQKMV